MLNKVSKVIEIVRNTYAVTPQLKDIVKNRATVIFDEQENGEMKLRSIRFTNGYDDVWVSNKGIYYHLYHMRNSETIITFRSLDEFLEKHGG